MSALGISALNPALRFANGLPEISALNLTGSIWKWVDRFVRFWSGARSSNKSIQTFTDPSLRVNALNLTGPICKWVGANVDLGAAPSMVDESI